MALADQYQLTQDPTFQNRVGAALFQACVNIASEGWTTAFHRERAIFAATVLANTASPNPYIQLFVNTVANDPTCISAATAAGTVTLTSGNRATQAALVTDTMISNAVSGEFNAFIKEPGF